MRFESFFTLKTFNFWRSLSHFSGKFWLMFCLWFIKLWSAVILSLPAPKSEFCFHLFNENVLKLIAKVEILFWCRCNLIFARQFWLTSLYLIRGKFLLLKNWLIFLFIAFVSFMTLFLSPLQQISKKKVPFYWHLFSHNCIFFLSSRWCLYYYKNHWCLRGQLVF